MPEIRVSDHALIISSMQQPVTTDPLKLLQKMERGEVAPIPEPERLIVLTGVYGGPVQVQTEFLDASPAGLLNGWEDVEEYSMILGPGPATIAAHEEFPVVVGELFEKRPLCYRVRVNARGRDTHYDLITEEVVESYLIQFWPAPRENPALLRAGSQRGSELFEGRIRLQ